MKLLLDTCVSNKAKKLLIAEEYDVIWSGDWLEDPGDERILNIAHKQQRIFITLDKDFGELAIVQGLPHYGIIRLVNISATLQATTISSILKHYFTELQNGAIITASESRIRIRL